jgi:trigger factor
MKIEKKDLPKGLVELKIVIDEKEFETYHAKAFAAVQQSVEVDGFRKGNAPENLIVQKYGDMVIIEEMANFALRAAYVKAVEDHKLTPIADPQVNITKIAKGNPLELTITVPVMPEITLPAYKKIAKDAAADGEKVEVTDKDIDEVLEELRKGRSVQHTQDHVHGEDCNHDEEEDTIDIVAEGEKKEEVVLPELNDAFAQSFGAEFTSLVELKSKVSENLKLEKEQKLREKRRTAIMEKLVAETKADLPDVLIESELNTMLAQMRADITRFGGTWEEYLVHTKKTEDEIKKDWIEDAHKRAMSQLLLHKIAQTEKLTATEEEVEVELVRLLATVQDADEERAKAYLYQALTNDKVLAFLEKAEA